MKYFPILDEVFSSDSYYFIIIALVIAVFIGKALDSPKINVIAMLVCLLVYGLCEMVCQSCGDYFYELISLIVGVVSIGGFLGFLIVFIVSKLRRIKIDREEK
ncbi:MAG: hypothetical protein MJ145_01790 [Clostridia bacterium]|nr:hypothetical protein [Clostridia bacterium]